MSNEELYKLIDDRFEAWELVELLEMLTAEDICRAFPDEVQDMLPEIKELLGLDEIEEEDESTDYDETD
jgi:hypothetical protein